MRDPKSYLRGRLSALEAGLSEYATPRPLRSLADIATSVVAYLAISVGMYFALSVSPLLALVLAPVSAVSYVRLGSGDRDDVGPRIVARNARPRMRMRMRNSVIWTDAALAVVAAGLFWLIGVGDVLLIWAPAALLAGAVGIWHFCFQHQFEDAYWQRSDSWSYADAALRGSSFLKLPKPLQFVTGNIGYHNIHHLSVRIPNYNLQRAHEENPILQSVPTLSLGDGLRAARLKLWDEHGGRLVTFAQARAG